MEHVYIDILPIKIPKEALDKFDPSPLNKIESLEIQLENLLMEILETEVSIVVELK